MAAFLDTDIETVNTSVSTIEPSEYETGTEADNEDLTDNDMAPIKKKQKRSVDRTAKHTRWTI